MRTAQTLALVLTMALAAACSNEQTATTETPAAAPQAASAASLTPEQLGEIGAQIRKEPARANEILTARGLDQQSFEKAIRDVTENPDSSKRYAEAYRKGSA